MLAEKLLRAFVVDIDPAYAGCRLGDYEACTDGHVDAEFTRRAAEVPAG